MFGYYYLNLKKFVESAVFVEFVEFIEVDSNLLAEKVVELVEIVEHKVVAVDS